MSSTLNINLALNTNESNFATSLSSSTRDPSKIAQNLVHIIEGAVGGSYNYSMDIQSSTSAKAVASGTIVITHANVANTKTTTIGGVVITAATSGNGTTSWTIGASATADGIAMAACINANTTLSPHLIATQSSGTVTLTSRLGGSITNLIVMSTSDATAFALTQLSGGAGGPEGVVANIHNTASP